MPVRLSEKFIAYLALLSGLVITVVAEYYSILGLTAIFSAAVIPVIIMGIALGIGKITATLWLKQNWDISPWSIRVYLLSAIAVLMLITSMGIFGFLSKAHSDQNLISGDAIAKIAVYDEKIRIEKENIDASRNALTQMDAQVNERLSRSSNEQGAERAVQIRKQQQAERTRIQKDILTSQSNIGRLSEERAPLAADVRKIEAEVGPIKYIAQFVYGETDQTLLEKAVTWVIIILIVVFDPLAVILLLSSQISFQNFREREKELSDFYEMNQAQRDYFRNDEPEIPSDITLDDINAEGDSPEKESDVVSTATVTNYTPHHLDTHPYLREGFKYPEGWQHLPPMVHKPEEPAAPFDPSPPGWMYQDNVKVETTSSSTYQILPQLQEELDKQEDSLFVQNEEQQESNLWSKTAQAISQEDYLNISQERLDQQVGYYASLLRNKQIDPKDIPLPLLQLVKSKV
jgi:hypothetical protein